MNAAPRTAGRTDAGFGMVELMVALAIAATVAMGIGSLIAFGAQLRDRTEAVSEIEQGLVALMALSATLERLASMELNRVGDTGFVLGGDTTANNELAVMMTDRELTAATVSAGSNIVAPAEASRVDLRPFDTTRFEYLVPGTAGRDTWTPAPLRASVVLAVRLVATKAHRTWPIVLWLGSPQGGVAR